MWNRRALPTFTLSSGHVASLWTQTKVVVVYATLPKARD